MNNREQIINDYIVKTRLPNSKIVSYLDKSMFNIYSPEDIPPGLALADAVYFDELHQLKYAFLKGESGEEMRVITGYTGCGKSKHYLLQQLFVAVKRGQSAIVTDMTGELPDAMYDYLIKHNVNVRILNFADATKTDTYNPLLKEAIKTYNSGHIGETTTKLMMNLTSSLIPYANPKDRTWDDGARSIFMGVLTLFFEEASKKTIKPEEVTLYNVIQSTMWLRAKANESDRQCSMRNLPYFKNIDPFTRSYQLISPQVETGSITRSGYFSVVNDNLSKINNEYTYNITSSNNINIEELWEKQTVLFVITDGQQIGDVVTRLLVEDLQLSAHQYSNGKIDKKLPRPIQLFLDEFCNIQFGDTQTLKKMLTTMRKHNVFFNIFLQSTAQLIEKYSELGAYSILANTTEVYMGSKDYNTRARIARAAGRITVESLESKMNGGTPSLVLQDLITPEALLDMKKGTAYVFRSGQGGILHTYYAPSYICPQFVLSNVYLEHLSNHKYDYEEKIIIPPIMCETKTPAEVLKLSYQKLKDYVADDIIDYNCFALGTLKLDKMKTAIYRRKGLIYEENGKFKATLSLEKINKLYDDLHMYRVDSDWN